METGSKQVNSIHIRRLLIILFFAVLSYGLWAGYSFWLNGYFGFPLDDGWIHQTYARNFAMTGQWEYLPGQVSGGSTAPLWTLFLSLFRKLGLGPFGSAGLLGFVFFTGAAFIFDLWSIKNEPNQKMIPFAAILFLYEWHLVWSALSGMETLLLICLILLVFVLLSQEKPSFFFVGILIGSSVWVRPDGITLLGPALLVALVLGRVKQEKIRNIGKVLLGFILIFVPYLLFNKIVAGQWMPNTFYAKQTEYAVLLEMPFLKRLGSLFLQPLVGVGILLVPGFLQQVYQSVRNKEWVNLSAILWFLGYILIYVVRLPVTYQHGRYLIPAMPVFFLIGYRGSVGLLHSGIDGKSWQRVVSITGVISACLILLLFWFKGAQSYQTDVAIIHEEMVIPSLWIRDHTLPNDLIAAHDIGALGYYGEREIIDLAGLISPEVIPFLRDEDQLLIFLQQSEVDYLMSFPDWYVELPRYGHIIFQSEGNTAKMSGYSNMAVYELDFH